ncbi:hypothetical protein T03_13629 [Trichinella britovi]|uniref:Uncharacterized protein n=1 Tax=Trichinella britovi TaxID=45882 RepID=A0A0V1DHA5_TRIBR|nr:hypothetical protein T03_13629 [Trichinella britovi]
MRYINVKLETVAINEKHAKIIMNGETLVEFAEADGSSDLFAVVLSIRADQNGVCSYFLASNEHLFVRLLWGFTCTYELMLKKKAILHIAFLVIVPEVQYELLKFVLVQCVELHFLSGRLSGKSHRKKLLLIECDKSFVDISGRSASPLYALPYTVRKATESMGAATTTKLPAARNDQKAIPKGAPFATNQRFKSSPRLNSSGQQYQLRYGTLLTRLLRQSPDAPANEHTAPLSSLTRSTPPTANRNTPHLSLYKRDYLMFMYY